MRAFMEQFAKRRWLDPLLPATWHSLHREFHEAKEGRSLVRQFARGYSEAVHAVFPEISFDPSLYHKYKWASVENRRTFFEKYAETCGFDPQIPTNWYRESRKGRILAVKGFRGVLFYHDGSFRKALLDLFPNIGLERSKFQKIRYAWSKPEVRRRMLEQYARKNKFDPLVADNWYMQCALRIQLSKGGRRVLSYHKHSLAQALMDLFPDIGLDLSQFGKPKKYPVKKAMWHKIENRRRFFTTYAKLNSFDPLVPENWYLQPKDKILSDKGARRVLFYHDGSFAKALVDLFPHIGLDISKFKRKSIKWDVKAQRRAFFAEYARVMGFDPLIPTNWYQQPKDRIKKFKGATAVLSFHSDSVTKALMELFPDIGLERQKFNQQSLWVNVEERRNFFLRYANQHGFDPLIPENWYKQSRDSILSVKGAHGVLYYHENSLSRALMDLFPDIGLNLVTLRARHSLWSNAESRRKFFEKYARKNGFDPLSPEKWYNQSKEDIMAQKGAQRVIHYHGNSLSRALTELFPTIAFDKSKFRRGSEGLWRTAEARRRLFERYAKEKGFDPLIASGWYEQSGTTIRAFKGVNRIIRYHSNSVATALLDLFPDVALNTEKLSAKQKLWHVVENRRNFFENFARMNNFDFLNADQWYTHASPRKILAIKGAATVIGYHGHSIAQALVDLFPDIGLQRARL